MENENSAIDFAPLFRSFSTDLLPGIDADHNIADGGCGLISMSAIADDDVDGATL